MEFPKTPEGAALVELFRPLGIGKSYLDLQVRRWCEWTVRKWGPVGSLEVANRLISHARRKGRNPGRLAVYLMKERHEVRWLKDEAYRALKLKYASEVARYRAWKSDHFDDDGQYVEGGIEALIQSMRRPPTPRYLERDEGRSAEAT